MTLNQVRLVLGWALALLFATNAWAASREEIDAEVRQAVKEFYKHTSAGKELSQKAAGMLVFPSVVKAGIGVGGEYGEGSLLIGGKPAAYYNIDPLPSASSWAPRRAA